MLLEINHWNIRNLSWSLVLFQAISFKTQKRAFPQMVVSLAHGCRNWCLARSMQNIYILISIVIDIKEKKKKEGRKNFNFCSYEGFDVQTE